MRFALCRAVMVAAVLLSNELAAQQVPQRLFVTGSEDGVVLPDVRAAAAVATGTVVLSRPAPAVHFRSVDGRISEWGRDGSGPGELRDPVDVAWAAKGGIVLDMVSRRLTGYSNSGQVTWTRSLGVEWGNRVAFVGRDTLVQILVPMTGRRAIARLSGSRLDTVLAYEKSAEKIHLAPPSGPSYTVVRPYVADAHWAPMGDRGIAFWAPGSSAIAIHDRSGREVGRYPIPGGSYALQPADRELWFTEAIPQDFNGRRVFEGVRALARSTVSFPDKFPPLTGLAGDDEGRLWVCRTASGSGEVWQQLSSGGTVLQSFRLPPGRQLLAFGKGVALARALSANDEPIVEAYAVTPDSHR